MSTAEMLFFRCIPEFVLLDTALPPYSRLLFGIIAMKAHLDTGIIQMTTDSLAEMSGLSVRTVLRYLPPLEAKGLIRVERAPRGSKIPNIYQIIGTAAEVVVRKGKTEAPQTPTGQSTPSRPVPESQSTPKRVSEEQSSSLNGQPTGGQPSAVNRPPDTPNDRVGAPQMPHQVTDRPLTKQEEQKSEYIEEDVVVDHHSTPLFQLDGIEPHFMQALINQHGARRVWEVLEQAQKKKKNIANLPGWVRTALVENWQFGNAARKNQEQGYQRFLSGRYGYIFKT